MAPTQLGEVTNDLMENEFSSIVNVDFTAQMETNLDLVEEGREDWVQTLHSFYDEFAKNLEQAQQKMGDTRLEVPDEVTDIICENCRTKYGHQGGTIRKVPCLPGLPGV